LVYSIEVLILRKVEEAAECREMMIGSTTTAVITRHHFLSLQDQAITEERENSIWDIISEALLTIILDIRRLQEETTKKPSLEATIQIKVTCHNQSCIRSFV
jgi:hypothetical protein